jgi:transposase
VANAIFFVLRTGCQWKAITRKSHGCCGSLAHLRFQEWIATGVFRAFWKAGLQKYDEVKGIAWEFQSTDGAMTKAPLGGALRGPIPQIAASRARRGRSRRTGTACRSG